jgi:hypothetical protein
MGGNSIHSVMEIMPLALTNMAIWSVVCDGASPAIPVSASLTIFTQEIAGKLGSFLLKNFVLLCMSS